MLQPTDAITNEVLEPIKLVVAYSTVNLKKADICPALLLIAVNVNRSKESV